VGTLGINCDLLTFSFSNYPAVDILGVMALNEVNLDSSQLQVMGVFYAENQIASQKQTSVAGTFLSNYFDMGQNVPAIYQMPSTVGNLPPGDDWRHAHLGGQENHLGRDSERQQPPPGRGSTLISPPILRRTRTDPLRIPSATSASLRFEFVVT
jgi:hypothetical protein